MNLIQPNMPASQPSNSDNEFPEWVNEHVEVRSFKIGSNTWQAALQLAIDYAHSIGGGTVVLPKRMLIECIKMGEKDTDGTTTTGSLQKHSFCVDIGDNTHIDLNEGEVKLKNNQNASLFVTKNMLVSGTAGRNISVYNGTFDMNAQNQTNPATSTMDAITFFNLVGLRLVNIKYKNSRDSSFKLLAVRNFFIDDQFTEYSDGDAYRMGAVFTSNPNDLKCYDGTIGTLEAENCSINRNGTLQGNPIIFSVKNVTIGQLRAKSCGGGYKLQDGCENISIGRAIFNGALVKDTYNSSANSGFKIQGGSNANPTNITIGEIISTDCEGEGLYVEAATNISIGRYIGNGNATAGVRNDVRLGNASRVHVTDIISILSGNAGVELRTDLIDYQIGRINVLNPASVTTNAGVVNSAVNGYIDSVIAKDDRATKLMNYGFSVPTTTSIGSLGSFETSGATVAPFKFDSPFYEIKRVLFDSTAPIYGQVTLTAGATSVVTNPNVKSFNRGAPGYNVPVIELMPANAAARTLLTVPLTYTVATGSFTIQHPTAAGTEKFNYRITGYVLVLTNIA